MISYESFTFKKTWTRPPEGVTFIEFDMKFRMIYRNLLVSPRTEQRYFMSDFFCTVAFS